jgi:hypothetical protein
MAKSSGVASKQHLSSTSLVSRIDLLTTISVFQCLLETDFGSIS